MPISIKASQEIQFLNDLDPLQDSVSKNGEDFVRTEKRSFFRNFLSWFIYLITFTLVPRNRELDHITQEILKEISDERDNFTEQEKSLAEKGMRNLKEVVANNGGSEEASIDELLAIIEKIQALPEVKKLVGSPMARVDSPRPKARAADDKPTEKSIEALVAHWNKNSGFEGIWKNLTTSYDQFLKNYEGAANDTRTQLENRWTTPPNQTGAAWERTRAGILNDWEIFKANYMAMAGQTRDDFAKFFMTFFKDNQSVLKDTGLTAEEAGKAVAGLAYQGVAAKIRSESSPKIDPKLPSPDLFHPPIPSQWSAPSKMPALPKDQLTAVEKKLQAISKELIDLQEEIKSGGLAAEQIAEKEKKILELQEKRFRLIDQGSFAKIDTPVPDFDLANRMNYVKPEETIFTDPQNHTNRWDISLGLFYDKPNMWTSTGAYAVNATSKGLTIANPIEFDDQPQLQLAQNDGNEITLGTSEAGARASVTATGSMSSAFKLTTTSGGSITYPIVQGSPYHTAFYDKTVPMISMNKVSNLQSVVIDGKTHPWSDLQKMTSLPPGKVFTLILNNGASWKIYGSQPVTFDLTKDGNRIKGLQGNSHLTGTLRVASIPSNPDYPKDAEGYEKLLDQYAGVLITKASSSTTHQGYAFAYQCVDMNGKPTILDPLVILKYPAQEALREVAFTTSLTYQTVHGPARAVVGSFLKFGVKKPEPTILPFLPKFEPDQLPILKAALDFRKDIIIQYPDVATDALYTPAKILQQQAMTLEYGIKVLKESGLSDVEISKNLELLADKLKKEMTQLLRAIIQWDSTWGSIVPASSSALKTIVADDYPDDKMKASQIKLKVALLFNPKAKVGDQTTDVNNEFGAGMFNDKALQFGYVITAAAILADYDQICGSKRFINQSIQFKGGKSSIKEIVNAICRDIANPSAKDPKFPQNRTIDLYSGQYIASGQTNYGDGRNLESTSEAYNCFVGMGMWGDVTDQKDLRDHALALAGMQAASSKIYYQIGDPSKSFYLPKFAKATVAVANYFDQKMDANTWFGAENYFRIGIQAIPAHPSSMANLHAPAFAKRAADLLIQTWKEIKNVDQHWKSIVLPLIAEVYPEKAEQLLAEMAQNGIRMDEGTNEFILLANILMQKNRLAQAGK